MLKSIRTKYRLCTQLQNLEYDYDPRSPRTVVAQSRPTAGEVLAGYAAFSGAIEGLAVVVRLQKAEIERLSIQTLPIFQVAIPWRHALSLLEAALKTTEQARDGIFANSEAVARAINLANETD